jgi:hypothetical protein
MKTIRKKTVKTTVVFLTVVFLCGIACYCFYKWRQTSRYDDTITVTASYMHYACGDCSIDMKVNTVDNKDYNFIAGHDALPMPGTKSREELCDFVGSIGYESSTGHDYIEEPFILVGHLNKNPHGLPFFDCSETPFFVVDKIKYGVNGEWKIF